MTTPQKPSSVRTEDVAQLVPHSTAAGKGKNLQIQWLRAIAAIMVVMCHASTQRGLNTNSYDGALTLINGSFGFFPVALFFAITGYLMSIAIKIQKPLVFLSHRLVRIYPFFLFVCLTVYVITHVLRISLPVDWTALALIPSDNSLYPLGGIEWTLTVEVSFYIALFLVSLLGASRHILWIAATWLVYLAVASWSQTESALLPTTILRSSTCAALAGGLLIPWILRTKIPANLFIAIGALGFFPLYFWLPHNVDVDRWLAAIWAVVILSGMLSLSDRNPNAGDNRIGRTFAKFGDYSYVLYLCHLPIIRLLYPKIHWLSFPMLWVLAFTASIVVAIVMGPVDVSLYRYLNGL